VKWLLQNLEEVVAAALVAAICVIVGAEVVLRYALAQPLSWTEELATILFVWIAMLGSSVALKRREHFAVELLSPNLGPRGRRALQFVVLLIVCALCVYLAIYGWRFVQRNWRAHTPALEWSRAVPYSAIPVCALLMLIRSVQAMLRLARTPLPEAAP
jgi:TRAP-type C4-dicarboxylate transport system permease small subunit